MSSELTKEKSTATESAPQISQRGTIAIEPNYDEIAECRDPKCPNKEQADNFISLYWKNKQVCELYEREKNQNSSEIILQVPNKNLIDYYIDRIMKSILYFILYTIFFQYLLNNVFNLNFNFFYIMLISVMLVLLEYFTIKFILVKLQESKKLLKIMKWFGNLSKDDEDEL